MEKSPLDTEDFAAEEELQNSPKKQRDDGDGNIYPDGSDNTDAIESSKDNVEYYSSSNSQVLTLEKTPCSGSLTTAQTAQHSDITCGPSATENPVSTTPDVSSVLAFPSSSSSSPVTISSTGSYSSSSSTGNMTAASLFSNALSSRSVTNVSSSKTVVPIDMMPTIPLVPVQVPMGRGGIVSLSSKSRGRPRGFGNQYPPLRPGIGIAMRKGKMKRISSALVRGSRRLVHSMSLDDKGASSTRDDSSFLIDDEIQYSQDDMFVMPTIQEKWPDKTCAFCCLSELSQLGQGELIRYDPTPGFSLTEKAHFTEDVLREASASKKLKGSLSKDKGKSPRKQLGEILPEPADEMAVIGHTERPSLAILFNTSGQCFSHYTCALWSYGVELTADDSITCVDKAVASASERSCSYCKKLGASIKCCVPDCEIWYHFPCATAVGAAMDLKSIALVCSRHSTKSREYLVEMACMVCEQTSPESSLLFCCSCGNHYHGLCLKPSLIVTPVVRAGWQCSDCKICQICRQPADEIVCGICDKSYHSMCARSQGLTHSRIGWKCKSCRVCGDCGSRTPGNGLSSRWHSNFTVCDSCYQLRNKGLACPVCKKAYRAAMQRSMAQCSLCKRHVHSQCDSDADLTVIQSKFQLDESYEYTCSLCSNNPTARLRNSQQFSHHSPDQDDTIGDLSHDASTLSEDSNDMEMIDERASSPVKSFSGGGTLSSLPSCSATTVGTTGGTFSQPPTSGIGLSALSNLQNSNVFDRSSSTFNSGASTYTRGKPFGLARRGGVLFPRMRGAVSKFNYGKKGVSSARKRGSVGTMAPARKGRGTSTSGRGYRGYFNYQPVSLPAMENSQSSGKEEGEENKLLLVCANDKYSLWQDVCAMCGAYGQDEEGRLIACAQCGQCYHPYCANVKVNRVVLEKGWRCLDCTVCEGCGERNDEARLVLCEDCDISCHIYCMSPPLEQVPAGIWKCKWCAVCQYCGATESGNNCSWQQNYSMCGPCYSMTTCPVCDEPYADAELIIQCSSCDRWLHASDDMIHTEDEAEKCIEKGYLCLMCRPSESLPPHLLPPSPPQIPIKTQSANSTVSVSSNGFSLNTSNTSVTSPTRSESPVDFMSKMNTNAEHWMDGTCLSDLGWHQIQNMTLQPVKKPRNIKGLRSSRGLSLDSAGSRDMDDDDDDDDEKMDCALGPQHWVYGMKEGTLLNAKEHGDPPKLPERFYTLPGPEPGTFVLRKRRYRNIKTVGIGGFQVRARAKKDEEKAKEEAEMDPQALELRRKRSKWRTKKKIKILEKFPSYIQEAFFGRNLMDTSNIEEDRAELVEEPVDREQRDSSVRPSIRLSQDELDLMQQAKEKHEQAKRQKLDGFVIPIEQPEMKTPNKTNQPLNPAAPGNIKEENGGVVSVPIPASTVPKSEEKKLKEEKVDEIVDDDENNDAIEALFGAGGSALISDDLVRDIMNDEIKDEVSFNEGEDRDQIDSEASVDGGKLTDLLGPGFNLDDVADIMKNLREESAEESTTLPATESSVSSSSVARNINMARSHVALPSAVISSMTPSVVSHHSQNPSAVLPSGRPVTAIVPATHPLPPHPSSVSVESPLTRLSQPVVAPLGAPSLPMRETAMVSSHMKAPNVALQTSSIAASGLPFYDHPSTTSLPPFMPEDGQQKIEATVLTRPEYNASAAAVASNVNSMQVVQQHIPKPVGAILAQHSSIQAAKQVQCVTVQHQSAVHHPQHLPYSALNANAVPMPVSEQVVSAGASITVQPSSCVSVVQSPHNVCVTTTSPSHQQSPVYHHYASNEPSPTLPTAAVSHVEAAPKAWPSTSENQSLSLTLEEDEALGPKATKAAVLYTNINKPSLKTDVALVQDRERQIKRIWKNLDAEQRKYYAQKARENKKEYFKNKQEHQRALKSQEKEAAAAAAAAASTGEVKGTGANAPVRHQNAAYSQQSLTLPGHQRAQGTVYTQPPPTQRPHDDLYSAQQQQQPQMHGPDIQVQQSPMREVLQQQWDEGMAPAGQQPLSSPTRSQVQFRQPLPPMGLNHQLRMKMPGHMAVLGHSASAASQPLDARMRLILQQQQQQQRVQSQQGQEQQLQMQHSQQQQVDLCQQPQQQQHSQPRQAMQPLAQEQLVHQSPQQHQQHSQHILHQQLQSQQSPQHLHQHSPSQMRLQEPLLHQQAAQMQQQQSNQHQTQQQHLGQQQLQQHEHPQSHIIDERASVDSFSALPLPQHPRLQQQLLMQGSQKMGSVIPVVRHVAVPQVPQSSATNQQEVHHPLSQRAQQQHTPQHVSELPDAVTRELLEQLEKEQHIDQRAKQNAKPAGSRELEIEGGGDLSQMEDELLSGIGDFKDLLEYAVSDRERIGPVEDSKLPTNLFDNLDEEDSKENFRYIKKCDDGVGHLSGTQKLQGFHIPSPAVTLSMISVSPVGTPLSSVVPSVGPSPTMGPSPSIRPSPTLGHSPTMGPSPVLGGPPSGHNSPLVVPQGPPSGPASAPGTPGTPGPHPGAQSPATPGPLGQVVPMGPSSGPIMAASRMVTSCPSVAHAQGQMQGQSGIMSQMPIHMHQPPQGFVSRMQPGSQHIIRQHQVSGQPPPPPPPYPGHPPSYSRPQVLPGEGLMVRSPMSSPLGGGPPVMRPHPHSPVMGNPPMMMGGPHRMPHPQLMGPQLHRRPLLLQEQPLLIEDIIEEEKREQMKQHKAVVIQQHHTQIIDGSNIPGNVVLRPPYQRLPSQVGSGPIYSPSGPAQQLSRPVKPSADPGLHPALLQAGSRTPAVSSAVALPIKTLPPPPLPPDNPQTDSDFQAHQQYESWLSQQNHLITAQQKYFDTEIAKLRRQRKSLNSKQRTLKKNGQELCERDATELDRIQKEAAAIQRQLDTCRKSSRQHAMLISEYNNKKRQRQSQMMQSHSPNAGVISSLNPPTPVMSGTSPMGRTGSSPMHSTPTPQSPLMSHSPSSQHGMSMSPMVPSPHTPVASPSSAAVPQHSPHGMMVPVPHPSPVDHSGPFSPQTRMPSPGTPASYGTGHPMMGHQGMRVRMPVLSPGGQTSQPGQMSSHMMVIRQSYSPLQNQMVSQSQGQPMIMRHQYPQTVLPMRRPSGSGPVPSPGSSGASQSPGGPSQSPVSCIAMKQSPVGHAPSPVSSIAMKPSPVHSGLKSPAPLASPQMRPHSTENPGTPQTPRSIEMTGNPLTPYNEQGMCGSQINSPHHSIPTPTPPSPAVSLGHVAYNSAGNFMDFTTSTGTILAGHVTEAHSLLDNRRCYGFENYGDTACDLGSRSINGGGGGASAPVPLPPDNPRYGYFKLGLFGGATVRCRWGHFKIGLRGGQPSPVEEIPVQTTNCDQTSSVTSTVVTTVTDTFTTAGCSGSPVTTSSVEYVKDNEIPEEGLAGVLSDSIKGRLPRSSAVIGVSQLAYVSAGCTTASVTPQLSVAANKLVVPEPLKSDIPPSSRHQAVIGIPGGGVITPQASTHPSSTFGLAPGMRLPIPSTASNYSVHTSYATPGTINTGTCFTNILDSIAKPSSVIPAPIMSVTTTCSSLMGNAGKHNIVSLARDVNTLATVVSASSQINNVLLSLASSARSDILRSSTPSAAIAGTVSENLLSDGSDVTATKSYIGIGSSLSRPLTSCVSSAVKQISSGSLSSSVLLPSVISSLIPHSSDIQEAVNSYSIPATAVSSTATKTIDATTVAVSVTVNNSSNTPTYLSQSLVHQPNSQMVYSQNANEASSSTMMVQTRPTLPHTLHHLPQQRMPVVLTAGSQSIPPLQVLHQQGASSSGQIVSANLHGQPARIIGTTIQQQPGSVVVQNQIPGQLPTTQIVQLPSISQLNAGQLTRTQVVQSLNQYGHVVQSSPSGQLIVHHQQQPAGMVIANTAGQVRMVGQQVMMQQGVIRGSGVMVKSAPQLPGGVVVKSGTQVQGGVRMMMIHNSSQRTPTPPPVARQTSPMMPPPAARSPASHSASPVSRVSPAPSPVAHSPSPHSPQVKSLSPHQGSPGQSPQHPSTPPVVISQMSNRKDIEDDKSLKSSEMNQLQLSSGSSLTGIAKIEASAVVKDIHGSAPNALLKQLLQNACSSNAVPSGQLVLVRSSPAGLSSHLSHVATQIPNPSTVSMPRSITDSIALRQAIYTTTGGQNTAAIHSVSGVQQGSIPHLTRTTLIPQQGTVLASSEHQPVSGLQVITQAVNGSLPQSVLINHNAPNTILTTQIQPNQQGQQYLSTGQHVSVRQSQTLVPSIGAATTQSSQTLAVTLPSAYTSSQVSQHQGNMQRTQQSGITLVQTASGLPNATLTLQNGKTTSPLQSLNAGSTGSTERTDSSPSVKMEMRVMIPESVGSCSGPSTGGDQTPEMNTPNDSCDDPEEAKKAKKRAQNQARRKSQTKDNKVQPAKRARQGSRVEEDYDSYIEGMMSQLRAMPPISVMEPGVPTNFNVCSIYGAGDLSKLGKKNYDRRLGFLEGPEGAAVVRNMNDYYNTQPYGPIPPMVIPTKGPTQKGFYNQEFNSPKIGLPLDEYSSEVDAVCLNKPGIIPTRELDSPDTVLSSSSPECVMPESPPPFKGLRLAEDDRMEDNRDRSLSPSVPLLVPVPIHAAALFEDKKFVSLDSKDDKENYPDPFASITVRSKIGLTPSLPLKDLGNVTVSLTLSSQASQDVSHVLRSLANLLNIPPPKSYNIIDHSLDNIKMRQSYRHSMCKDGKEQMVDMQSILNGQVKFCKQCSTLVLQNIMSKKVTDMPFLPKEEYEGVDDVTFCSKNCFVQFAMVHRVVVDDKSGGTFVSLDGKHRVKDGLGMYLNENIKGSSVTFMSGDGISDWKEGLDEVLRVPQLEDERRSIKHKLGEEEEEYPRQEDGKRFRGHHYKYWSKDSHLLPEKYEKPTNKEMTDLLFGMKITYRMTRLPEDSRQCSLCPLYGDYVSDGPSRLLNFDVDKWVHLNCALWADDVYETMSGSLVNVEVALKKAINLICEHCEQSGASVRCFKVRCNKVFHLHCAVKEGCTFYKNKTIYCPEHINKGDKENELSTLAVFRRVFIDRDENRQVATVMHHTEMNHVLRIGSLILMNIGQLLPHQLQAFHSPVCIYPIGYLVIRFYWSMRRLHKRCAYECSIHEVEGQPEFRITVKEEGYEDLNVVSRSPKGVWNKILEPIAEMRQNNDVVKLFPQYISGEDLFGLTEPTIVRILESMPGIDTLSDYTFKYGSNPLFELPLAVNPTGCARSEPFNKTHMKRHIGMRTCAGSVKSGGNLRTAATIASLSMFDPFTPFGKQHSRYFQYKKMKNEWRSVVYLARSKIQGLGLYAARDIERNTAIIEYIGEIIRSEVAEIREKRYESQNRGVYMFRLDDSRVVDATVTGGLARYINHSCGPNCFTETVEVEKDVKIVIVSNRKINRGEELAYDYKFDEEEDHKIPCLCGAENCRKWMN